MSEYNLEEFVCESPFEEGKVKRTFRIPDRVAQQSPEGD
jgi:hypothetical protein